MTGELAQHAHTHMDRTPSLTHALHHHSYNHVARSARACWVYYLEITKQDGPNALTFIFTALIL